MAFVQDHELNLSHSEDDDPGAAEKQAAIKRGTRACDRCRKIKSKCEAGADEKCKNCEIANTPCTFQGPSFKRGPPKGYIHSIEQRWHQVECILATIMETPRSQEIVNDLRRDAFANAILNRVQNGPYGSRSRLPSGQRLDPTSDSFYSSLIAVPEHTPVRDDRRSRRQSRISREIVSQDPTASATPTREWQEQLARRLAQGSQWGQSSSPLSPPSRSPSAGVPSDYARTRRRLDWSMNMPVQNWDNLYTMSESTQSANENEVDQAAEAFGHLSVDQNKEFRYHGPASGLPLLAQSNRKGDSQQDNRIWKFAASVDPETAPYDVIAEEEDVEVQMPSPETQKFLLQLYFTYVHPFYPVIHKQDFLYQYNALSNSAPPPSATVTSLNRHPMQRPCKMLLLAMFAIAARFSHRTEDHPMHNGSNLSKAGQQFAIDAHKLLDRKYQSSRPSTCQALLLLAVREFGMGAMDKGWLYSGMAMRMAVDLGMNRNSEGWTIDGKEPVFNRVEMQIRKHIWWSCCISDKLSAVWLGRPITFRANDYSIPLPEPDEVDENETWQPYPVGILGDFAPQTSYTMTSFKEACHLSVIITDIMDKIYPVEPPTDTPRRVIFERLEERLNKWQIELPDPLRYPPQDRHSNVLPHILMLHIEYHAAVLLLHRAFLPPYDESSSQAHSDPLPLKAFDVCTAAAVQISALAEVYNEKFGMERAPPFMCIYLQSAGIMHVITLARRPWDPQASLGLSRCITACRRIERLWPTATRLRHLLEGAKVQLDESTYSLDSNQRKRSVDEALGSSKNPDVLPRDLYGLIGGLRGPAVHPGHGWGHVPNGRTHPQAAVAGSSGVPNTGMASFYPGDHWWPSQLMATESFGNMGLSSPTDVPPVSAPMPYTALPSYTSPQHPGHDSFSYNQAQLPQEHYSPFDFSQYPHPNERSGRR